MSAAHFCSVTGVRIVAPGVCKTVDPINGQAEFSEQPDKAPAPIETKSGKDHNVASTTRRG